MIGRGGQIPLGAGFGSCVSPKIAFGPHHVLYYIYQENRTNQRMPRAVMITTSRNDGRKFGRPVLLDPYTDRIVHQQVAIAVDRRTGRVYVAWAHLPNPKTFERYVVVASSTNEGRSFSKPVPAVPRSQFTLSTDEAWLAISPKGTLYVSGRDFPVSNRKPYGVTNIYEASAKNHGRTFGPAHFVMTVDAGCATCDRPSYYAADNRSQDITLGTKPGVLYSVGWGPPGLNYARNRRIFFSVSHDFGRRWSRPRIVGIPRGFTHDDQARPSITVTPQGRIEIVYQEMGTSPDAVQNIYEIHSDDGGKTFSTPRRLDTKPSNARIGPSSFDSFSDLNIADLGPHEALAANATTVFVAWTDTRRGTVVSGKQDVFFARLPAR